MSSYLQAIWPQAVYSNDGIHQWAKAQRRLYKLLSHLLGRLSGPSPAVQSAARRAAPGHCWAGQPNLRGGQTA